MMELDSKYCDVILQRWCNFTGEMAYRLNDDGSKTSWTDAEIQEGG